MEWETYIPSFYIVQDYKKAEVFVLVNNLIYCINQGTDAVKHVRT